MLMVISTDLFHNTYLFISLYYSTVGVGNRGIAVSLHNFTYFNLLYPSLCQAHTFLLKTEHFNHYPTTYFEPLRLLGLLTT